MIDLEEKELKKYLDNYFSDVKNYGNDLIKIIRHLDNPFYAKETEMYEHIYKGDGYLGVEIKNQIIELLTSKYYEDYYSKNKHISFIEKYEIDDYIDKYIEKIGFFFYNGKQI